MQHRSRHTHAKSLIPVAALVATCALAGCSVGPVNLDEFVGIPTVEEALAARRSTLAPVVTDDALIEADTLTVGLLDSQSAPEVITSADGTPTGLDVDTAHALADALGLAHVSFVSVSNVADSLGQTCDVVMGVTADEAGDAAVVGAYAQSATALFAAGEVAAPVDASALDGATVGVQGASVSATMLDDLGLNVTQQTYANLNEAFDALAAGEVDYVACDANAGAYLATAQSGVSFAGTLDDPVTVGVAVSSGELQTALTGVVEQVQTNGTGDVARTRWLGALPTLTTELRVTGLDEAAPAERPDAAAADAAATDAAAADAAPAAPADGAPAE